MPDNKSASDKDYISMAQLCEMLSISRATGKNWIRLGKVEYQLSENGHYLFEKSYAEKLRNSLRKGTNPALRSRRNKTFASGRNLYNAYVSADADAQRKVERILQIITEKHIAITSVQIRALVAEWALRLLNRKNAATACLKTYLSTEQIACDSSFLIDDIIGSALNRERILKFIDKYPELFETGCEYEPGEDALGLLYISLSNLSSRKATGTYYTPTAVVQKLCRKVFETHDTCGKKILDPCCGTGNFLIRLPEQIGFEQIYANDLDPLSVCITRVNLAVRYGVSDKEMLYQHVTRKNYLMSRAVKQFDFVIGNPPWGYSFTKSEQESMRKRFEAAGNHSESYDLFVEQALRNLREGGMLSFVLPEAILNSRSHILIRRKMLRTCTFEYLAYLGNVFDGVNCPSIVFQMRRNEDKVQVEPPRQTVAGMAIETPKQTVAGMAIEPPKQIVAGMQVETPRQTFVIGEEREVRAEYFDLMVTDQEYKVLRKVADPEGKRYLAGSADFALGIVTGGNGEVITEERTEGSEPVWRGTDVLKYRCAQASAFIRFEPEKLQQAAPERYYRAPEKLLYRFINRELVFAYDDSGNVSLNSCNVLIPGIEGLQMKYVLAVLNSRVAQFFFEKTFNSVKVLRSHLEQIPIPDADAKQQSEIIEDVDRIIAAGRNLETESDEWRELYERIDGKVAALYGLSEAEYRVISGKNG